MENPWKYTNSIKKLHLANDISIFTSYENKTFLKVDIFFLLHLLFS